MQITAAPSATHQRPAWTVEQGSAHTLETARVAVQRAFVSTSNAGDYDPRDVFWNLRAASNVAVARAAVNVASDLAAGTPAHAALKELSGSLRGVVAELIPAAQRTATDALPALDVFAKINATLAEVEDVLDAQLAALPQLPKETARAARPVPPSPLHPTAHRIMLERAQGAVEIAQRGAELVSADTPSLRDSWAAWMRVNHMSGINDALAGLQVPGASGYSPSLVQTRLTPTIDAVEQIIRAVRSGDAPSVEALNTARFGFAESERVWQMVVDQLTDRSPAAPAAAR